MTKEERKEFAETKAKIPVEKRKKLERAAKIFAGQYGEAIKKLANE
jgi:hypothetical protein